jgi:hypothetical protein
MKEIISTLHNNQAASLYSVAAITALVLLCASFQAQSAGKEEKLNENVPTQTSSSKFNKLDANQDGKLSHEEVVGDKGLIGKFDVLDLDVNGTLDAKEYDAFTSAVQKK